MPVDFVGFIQPKELFDQIDVLIVPSIWAEPLPRTILEAYAAGVPVIGADSGGIPDLIGTDNTDWLYPPNDAAALKARMSRIMQVGRESLPGKDRFLHVLSETTPPQVASRYLELYRSVMARQAQAA